MLLRPIYSWSRRFTWHIFYCSHWNTNQGHQFFDKDVNRSFEHHQDAKISSSIDQNPNDDLVSSFQTSGLNTWHTIILKLVLKQPVCILWMNRSSRLFCYYWANRPTESFYRMVYDSCCPDNDEDHLLVAQQHYISLCLLWLEILEKNWKVSFLFNGTWFISLININIYTFA